MSEQIIKKKCPMCEEKTIVDDTLCVSCTAELNENDGVAGPSDRQCPTCGGYYCEEHSQDPEIA